MAAEERILSAKTQLAFWLFLVIVTVSPVPVIADEVRRLPIVDISQETDRHVVIAAGTEAIYQGHPTT